MIPRMASRPGSFGANSSTRTPYGPTCARTVTGPRLSGGTLTVTTCWPDPAAARPKVGRAGWVMGGVVGAGAATGALGVTVCVATVGAGAIPLSGLVEIGASAPVELVKTGAAPRV